MESGMVEAGARAVTRRELLGSAAIASVALTPAESAGGNGAVLPYSPAIHTYEPLFKDPALTEYPIKGKPVRVPSPFAMTSLVSVHDGTMIYAQALGQPPAIFAIELSSKKVRRLEGSEGIGAERMILSKDETSIFACGHVPGFFRIVEWGIASGKSREVFRRPMVDQSFWWKASLTPDGAGALICFGKSLELVDFRTGLSKSVLDGFSAATWSPNGAWIAAIPHDSDNAVLLDAKSFSKVRELGPDALEWSPDSRFVLGYRLHAHFIIVETGTLEIVEAETGRRVTVKSSNNKFFGGLLFWMKSGLLTAS